MSSDFDAAGCGEFRLTNVYGRISATQAEEVVRLWLDAGVLPEPEARRRCAEVVYMFHDRSGRLMGVNTVYTAEVAAAGKRLYFYRTFIRPESRGSLRLPRVALAAAFDFLKQRRTPSDPAGMVIVTDNIWLAQRRVRQGLRKLGFHMLGSDARGRDVWCQHFDGSPIDFS